jgi:hypothetical protein
MHSSASRRFVIVLGVAVAAAALATGVGARTPSVLNCGSLSTGPTAFSPGKTGGPECLLRAYAQHCRPAVYELSRFGIDTIARDNFRLVMDSGRCRIKVATSFTVVPQKPRPQGSGACSNLSARGKDIIASGCVGSDLQSFFSLTGKS